MLKKLYLKFREEKTFLRVLCTFVLIALSLHFVIGYDPEWGSTNLTLSIEAAIASAVIMMEQKRAGDVQEKQLRALLAMAEAERDALLSQGELLRAIKQQDERLISILEKRS